jgi:hypothetical protein
MRSSRRYVLVVTVALTAGSATGAVAADPVPPVPRVEVDRQGPHTSGPDNSTAYWSNNSLTGYCGQTDGGYVIAAQSLLYAYGFYGGLVDGYWGPKSHEALVAYQTARHLKLHEGCAGPETWADMQQFARYYSTSDNCRGGAGSLAVYKFGSALFDRASATHYWYSDPWQQSRGSAVGDHLYRFSDDFVARC